MHHCLRLAVAVLADYDIIFVACRRRFGDFRWPSLRTSSSASNRRRPSPSPTRRARSKRLAATSSAWAPASRISTRPTTCLLYTSDAADDLLCVDLGGRRIIKKKKKKQKKNT